MSTQPIFIVGPPRSGTTLLAAMMANHSRIACGPETQFFSKIDVRAQMEAVRDPGWPAKAVERLSELTLVGQRVSELFQTSVAELHAYLAKCPPSVTAMLEALTATYAAKCGKTRWAEKTPNHLLYGALIRSAYRGAPFVRIVRDPRDVALSMRQLPWASRSVLANGYLWEEWFRRSHAFFAHDRQTLTVRYEDLIADPGRVLREICSHLGEEFETRMLQTELSGNAVSTPGEPWKASVRGRLDASRVGVWRRELSPELEAPLSRICAAGMEAFGYVPVTTSATG